MRRITVVQCILILGLNVKAMIEHTLDKKESKVGKIDRILCISLSVFDLAMGSYLFIIIVKMYESNGSYCVNDINWRYGFLKLSFLKIWLERLFKLSTSFIKIMYYYYASSTADNTICRSSLLCSITGALFDISTKGSLLTAMMMSVTRCLTITTPFSDRSFKWTVAVHFLLQIASFSASVLPILPIYYVQVNANFVS